jgi:hypothetical protein
MKNEKYYVTMTDKFLSGWGCAAGKTEKYVIVCDTIEQAKIAAVIAMGRSDMRRVSIRRNKPYYNKQYYHTTFVSIADAPGFQGKWDNHENQ